MTKRVRLALLLGAGVALAALPAGAAGPFDGSKPLLCAVTDTDQCEDDGACLDGDAEDLRAPSFVRIDVGKKEIQVLDAGREGETTAIQSVTSQEGRLVLQGVEAGRGWSLVISEAGETTLSVSDDGIAMAAFGNCTAL